MAGGAVAAPAFEPPESVQQGDAPRRARSLDLGFLELDVLAHDRVILPLDHLLGHVAGVLLRHVEETGIGGGDQPDLDGCGLRHGVFLVIPVAARLAGEPATRTLKLAGIRKCEIRNRLTRLAKRGRLCDKRPAKSTQTRVRRAETAPFASLR